MQMYACRRTGRTFSIASAIDFRGISKLMRDTTSLKINKEERTTLALAGLDATKESFPDGALMIYPTQSQQLLESLLALQSVQLPAAQAVARDNFIKFITVCIQKNYVVRLY